MICCAAMCCLVVLLIEVSSYCTILGTAHHLMPGCHSGQSARSHIYSCADKSLARPTSQCILFDGENISFDASLVIYINSTNIPPIMIINRIYETQNLLSP
jgi:hypothetical protein